MNELIIPLLNSDPEDFIAARVQSLLDHDSIFQSDITDLSEIEAKIEAYRTDKTIAPLIYDYIACANSLRLCSQELAYIAGCLDILQFLPTAGYCTF